MISNRPRAEIDVLVIGGGFAGVTAARELRRAGRSVTLLEARDRLGGRTWLKPNALHGLALEMGGTWVDPRQRFSWAEIERYQLPLGEPECGAMPSTWLAQGRLRHDRLPVPVEELGALEGLIVGLDNAARRVDFCRPMGEQDLADLDIAFDQYLEQFRLPPATHDIAVAFFQNYGSAPATRLSALHLIRRIAAAGSVAEFVLSGVSYPIRDGTSALVAAIIRDADAKVILSAPVRSIRQGAAGITAATPQGTFEAKAAVLAVPANVMKNIEFQPSLTQKKLALSREELACGGVKVWAAVRGVPEAFSSCGLGEGLDMVWTEDTPLDHANTLVVGYGPDAEVLDISSQRDVERAIRVFIPNAVVTGIAGHDWRHDPYALETWASFRPGQITRYDGEIRKPEGRLIFAGAHTGTRWPGFIDGAIESGFRAAREAIICLDGIPYETA